MTLIDRLVADVDERPRLQVSDLADWQRTEGPTRRLLAATGRWVDITSRPSLTVTAHDTPITDGELARPWLHRIHEAQRPKSGMAAKRIPWRKEAAGHLATQPPLWFDQPFAGDLAYVDIRGAYASIYSRSTLDCTWRPGDLPKLSWGRFDMLGAPELLGEKGVHIAVGGILRATEMRVLDRGRAVKIPTTSWSRYLCPDLWGLIVWTLHAIASDAVRLGARYVNKDGYIVPADQADALVGYLADAWNMEARVQATGPGEVKAMGCWSIGDHLTKARVQHGRQINTLVEVPLSVRRLLVRARARDIAPCFG